MYETRVFPQETEQEWKESYQPQVEIRDKNEFVCNLVCCHIWRLGRRSWQFRSIPREEGAVLNSSLNRAAVVMKEGHQKVYLTSNSGSLSIS